MNRIFKKQGRLHQQRGVMLLEALIGLMIFSIGILAMIGMQATAFSMAADAKYRADAAAYANDIISRIWVGVGRTSDADTTASLTNFQYNTGGANCAYTGGAVDATNAVLSNWVSSVTGSGGLLGATNTMLQITVAGVGPLVAAPDRNRVTVTICWQSPQDLAPRKHQVITYVY